MWFVSFLARCLGCALLLATWLGHGSIGVLAQVPGDPKGEARDKDEEGPIGSIREWKFPLFLKDHEGRMVFVPPISFEEWERMFKTQVGAGRSAPPTHVIESLSVAGDVQDSRVTLRVSLRMRIRGDSSGLKRSRPTAPTEREKRRVPTGDEDAADDSRRNDDSGKKSDKERGDDGAPEEGKPGQTPVPRPEDPDAADGAPSSGRAGGVRGDGMVKRRVRVPLALDNAALVPDSVEYRGDGEQFLTRDDGFIWWVEGDEGSGHELSFECLVRLEHAAGETGVQLLLPTSTVAEVVLRVPTTSIDVRLDDEAQGIATTRALATGTEIRVQGSLGDGRIAWSKSATASAQPTVGLHVEGHVQYDIENATQRKAAATLRVRNFSGPFSSFTVALPAGLQLTSPTSSPDYRLAVVVPPERHPRDRQYVLVTTRNPVPIDRRIEIQLEAATPAATGVPADTPRSTTPRPSNDEVSIQLGGFEVLEAIKHVGEIDFRIGDSWTLTWQEGRGVERVPEPAGGFPDRSVARFRYSGQPYSLTATTRPRQQNVRVDPKYELRFVEGRVDLIGQMRCRVQGAKTRRIEFDTGGWEIDDVEPPELMEDFQSRGALLEVQLKPAADSSRDFQITIHAHRRLVETSGKLSFPMVRPLEKSVPEATVTVVAPERIRLSPESHALSSLYRIDHATTERPTDGLQRWVFRQRATSEPVVFAADYELRSRTVQLTVENEVEFTAQTVRTLQTLSGNVSFEPLDSLALLAPHAWIRDNKPEFRLTMGDQPLVPVVGLAPESGDGWPLLVRFPRPVLGEFTLHVESEQPLRPPSSAQPSTLEAASDVEFLMPVRDPQTTLNVLPRIGVVSPPTLRVSTTIGEWKPLVADATVRRAELTLPASLSGTSLRFLVERVESEEQGTLVVRKYWLQTWLSRSERRDRAAFRIRTNLDEIQIRLPRTGSARLKRDDLRIAVHGAEVANYRQDDSTVTVALPERAEAEVTLELWYRFEQRPENGRRFDVDPPRIVGAGRADVGYWQLITPPDEHLLWSPSALTPEMTWEWQGWRWGRHSIRAQADLEEWIEGTSQDVVPTSQANQYLFVSLGSLESWRVMTLRRPWILLLAGGVTLVVGLAWIYLPVLRHPSAGLLASIALVGVAFCFPDPVLVVAQAIAAGLLLLVLAWGLQWSLAGRQPRAAVVRSRSALADSRRLESQSDAMDVEPVATTAALPVAAGSAVDSRP